MDVVEHTHTSIGSIYLERYQPAGRTDWVFRIHIEGQLLMSSISPVSERQLSSSALAMHPGPGPLRVLVGGLGLGYTAQAALADPRVSSVRALEMIPTVIEWMQRGLLPLSAELNDNPRFEYAVGDCYKTLLAPPSQPFDLILVDVDHAPDDPLSPDNLPFYTDEGQQAVARHLAPGGVLGVWSAHDNDDFAAVMARAYGETRREHVRWPNEEGDDDFHNVLFLGRRFA